METSRFKYLDAYQKEDFDHFFGRNREIARLYNAVHASNLILLYGASGTGKTSLVNCGLANKFYDTDWLPLFVRREENIIQSTRREANRLLKDAGQDKLDPELSLPELIKHLYQYFFRTIYLIFDQFEEFFVIGEEAERQYFYLQIARLLKAKLPCKVLIIIREEYLAYLSDFEKVVPALFDNRLRIEKMNNLNLYRVISGTAQYAGIQINEPKDTIPAIVENIRNPKEGVELGHLQIYLDNLFYQDAKRTLPGAEKRNPIFDMELVGESGQLENIISDFLSKQLKSVESELVAQGHDKDLALELLYTLVTDEGTKRLSTKNQIINRIRRRFKLDRGLIDYCLDRFHELKLIRLLPDD